MNFYQRTKRQRLTKLHMGSQLAYTTQGPIEYTDHGDGLPALVLHGILGSYEHGYNYASPLLERDMRIIAPSRPGYFNTPACATDDVLARQADLLAALLDELGLRQVAVIAISGSGPVGMAFADRYPERCSSLTLISAITQTPKWFRLWTLWAADWVLNNLPASDAIAWVLTHLFTAAMPLWSLFKPQFRKQIQQDEENRALYKEVVLDFFPISILASGLSLDLKIYGDLDGPMTIDTPTLLVHSCRSLVLPRHHAVAVEQSRTPTKTLYIENAGHAMHISHQDTVWDRVKKFCLEQAPTTALVEEKSA